MRPEESTPFPQNGNYVKTPLFFHDHRMIQIGRGGGKDQRLAIGRGLNVVLEVIHHDTSRHPPAKDLHSGDNGNNYFGATVFSVTGNIDTRNFVQP